MFSWFCNSTMVFSCSFPWLNNNGVVDKHVNAGDWQNNGDIGDGNGLEATIFDDEVMFEMLTVGLKTSVKLRRWFLSIVLECALFSRNEPLYLRVSRSLKQRLSKLFVFITDFELILLIITSFSSQVSIIVSTVCNLFSSKDEDVEVVTVTAVGGGEDESEFDESKTTGSVCCPIDLLVVNLSLQFVVTIFTGASNPPKVSARFGNTGETRSLVWCSPTLLTDLYRFTLELYNDWDNLNARSK